MEHRGANVQLISHCDKHTTELNKSDDLRKRKTSMDMQIDAERLVLRDEANNTPHKSIIFQH